MTKNTKIAIAVIGAIGLYLILKPSKVKAEAPKVDDMQSMGGCASLGLTKCANSDKCYDQNINYLVDPCLEISSPVDLLPPIS